MASELSLEEKLRLAERRAAKAERERQLEKARAEEAERERQLEKTRAEEADARAEKTEKESRNTNLPEYLTACHDLLLSRMTTRRGITCNRNRYAC
jgi:Tfp pilus assembly protein FimV